VDHNHVLLCHPGKNDGEDLGTRSGITARRVKGFDGLSPEDMIGSGDVTLKERRGMKVQHHAAVTGKVAGRDWKACKVSLGGDGISLEQGLDSHGGFFFLGLSPGRYRLRLFCGDGVLAERRFPLARGEVVRVHFNTHNGETRQ
jgi:hypothetical protein